MLDLDVVDCATASYMFLLSARNVCCLLLHCFFNVLLLILIILTLLSTKVHITFDEPNVCTRIILVCHFSGDNCF